MRGEGECDGGGDDDEKANFPRVMMTQEAIFPNLIRDQI